MHRHSRHSYPRLGHGNWLSSLLWLHGADVRLHPRLCHGDWQLCLLGLHWSDFNRNPRFSQGDWQWNLCGLHRANCYLRIGSQSCVPFQRKLPHSYRVPYAHHRLQSFRHPQLCHGDWQFCLLWLHETDVRLHPRLCHGD